MLNQIFLVPGESARKEKGLGEGRVGQSKRPHAVISWQRKKLKFYSNKEFASDSISYRLHFSRTVKAFIEFQEETYRIY